MALINLKNLQLPSLNNVEKFGFIILLSLLVFLLVLSCRFNVHQYDSFEYINNARQLIGIQTRYDILRPPCFTIVLLPFAYLAKLVDSHTLIERAPYLIMTTAGFCFLLIFWQMIRSQIVNGFAIIAILAMAFNSLFLHYWMLLMPEVFACFLLVVFWDSINKERFLLAAVALGFALNLRYQLLPLGFLAVIYSTLTQPNLLKDRKWLELLKNYFITAFIALAILLAFHYIALVWGANLGFISGLQEIVTRLNKQFGVTDSTKHDSTFSLLSAEFDYLSYYVTGPILLLALIGMLKAIYQRKNLDYLFFIWFWGIFLSIALVIQLRWKEPRYLIVVFPPIYYFFISGLSLIWEYLNQLLKSTNSSLRNILLAIFSLALAIAPLSNAKTELLRLCDKSYTKNVGTQLATVIKPKVSASEPVFWAGDYYTIAPESYLFSSREKYFFFNLFSNGLSFYLDRPCYYNYSEQFIYNGAVGSYLVINRNVCQDCRPLTEIKPIVPLTIHKVTKQTKFYPTNQTTEKFIENIPITFSIFRSNTAEELYLTETVDKVIFQKTNPEPNALVQFIYKGERLPIYAERSYFGLPNQASLTQRLQIATVDFVLVSELSPSLGEVK